MLNRTFLYLTRKKGKTVTLLILIFLTSTFVTTSFALMNTTNEISRLMRESVNATITINQIRRQDPDGDFEIGEIITQNNINDVIEIDGVASYNAISSGTATSDDIIFRRGLASGATDNMGRIRGVNDSSLMADFTSNQLTLIDGRHILPTDELVIMISQTLANENNLSVGDFVTLKPTDIELDDNGLVGNAIIANAPNVEVKIIGIFADDDIALTITQPSVGFASNQMIADHSLMMALELAVAGHYESVTFHITDPSNLPNIVSEARQIDNIEWDDFFMRHDDGDYLRIASDLSTIQNLLTILLIAIGVISIGILTLILILRMRERLHEVGILLSVGIPKFQIIGGFLLEITIIAMIAFVGSYLVAMLIVPTLNNILLADLITATDLYRNNIGTMSAMIHVIVYLVILLVVLTTAYLSTLLIIRIKPKQILAKMS